MPATSPHAEVAERLRGVVRAEDTVARMGGDEFAVVMEDLDDIEVVTAIATRIIDEVSRPFVLNGQEVIDQRQRRHHL